MSSVTSYLTCEDRVLVWSKKVQHLHIEIQTDCNLSLMAPHPMRLYALTTFIFYDRHYQVSTHLIRRRMPFFGFAPRFPYLSVRQ
jgi:hypothetical protein